MSTEVLKESEEANRNFNVEIAGISLNLRTNHPKEVVDELVRFVDGRCRRAMNASRKTNVETAAVLAALSIAEDLFSLKQETKQSLDRLSINTGKLLSQLESSGTNKQS